MIEGALLVARKIDHVRTDVHIDAGGALTKRKALATNEVLTVVMRCCGVAKHEELGEFLRTLHVGETAVLACDDLDSVASKLGLVVAER